MSNPLTPILAAIAKTITFFHDIFGRAFGETHGAAWVLSIVFLVVTIRLLLFPIFVKQIKSQRAMQELQPKIKALQAKHKGDRETLNQELMKLYKEQGVNPLAGCLPLLLQAPIFIALFQVLRQLGPSVTGEAGSRVLDFPSKFGVPESTAEQLGRAKVFGAPIAAAFNSPGELLRLLDASATSVKVVAVVLIVTMSLTTFLTTKQMMAKNAAAADPQQAMQQKILLYVMPLFLALFGFGVPLGVLIYWTTSNLWSMGQQAWVIRHMPHPAVPGAAPAKAGTGTSGKADKQAAKQATKSPPAAAVNGGRAATEGAPVASAAGGTPARTGARAPQNRPKKKARSQRRGGRR